MTNRMNRGSAPGRERDANRRPGSFKPGHKKQGGRKRGTPNALTADYRKAMLEAAYRVGEDGNGKDGLVGYLKWVAVCHPTAFLGPLGIRIMLLQCAERDPPERSFLTMEELNQAVRDEVGLTGKEQTKKSAVPPKSRATADWTGQDFPVGSLMQVAVGSPAAFCKLLAAMLPQPPTASQRARRDWERRARMTERSTQ